MNDPCPICGKERGTVVGDFPRSYFCEGHKNTAYYGQPMFGNDHKIIELLEKIIKLLEAR